MIKRLMSAILLLAAITSCCLAGSRHRVYSSYPVMGGYGYGGLLGINPAFMAGYGGLYGGYGGLYGGGYPLGMYGGYGLGYGMAGFGYGRGMYY